MALTSFVWVFAFTAEPSQAFTMSFTNEVEECFLCKFSGYSVDYFDSGFYNTPDDETYFIERCWTLFSDWKMSDGLLSTVRYSCEWWSLISLFVFSIFDRYVIKKSKFGSIKSVWLNGSSLVGASLSETISPHLFPYCFLSCSFDL